MRLRTSLAPLASPSGLSWPVVAVFGPLVLITQAFLNAGSDGGSLALWALASALGLVAVAAVIAAARLLLCRRDDPALGAVLVAYVLAALAQVVVLALVAQQMGLIPNLQLGYRLLAALLGWLPLLALTGFAVATHAAHRRVIVDLMRKREGLLRHGPSLDAELDRLEAELAGAVRASVEPALESLDTALRAAARRADDRAALDAIDAVVDDLVRPVSHELVAAGAVSGPGDISAASRPVARVPLPRRFVVAAGIRPALAAIAVVILAIPSASHSLTGTELVAYLCTLGVVCWVGLWVAQRAFGQWMPLTIAAVALIVVVHALVAAAAMALINAVGIAAPPGVLVGAMVLMGAIGGLVAGSMIVGARRAESEAELAVATARLEGAVAFILRRQRLVRRRLAFVLHGSLQGALHAAALRVGEGAHIDAAQVDAVRADVAAALAQLEAPRWAADGCLTTTALNDLGDIWQGHRMVTVHVHPAVEPALRADPDADESVAEVVREAVNNAFRHGAASTVDVAVTVATSPAADGHAAIVIDVRDNGRGRRQGSTPGLGTTLFNDVCRQWEHSGTAGASTFRAEVALAAPVARTAV